MGTCREVWAVVVIALAAGCQEKEGAAAESSASAPPPLHGAPAATSAASAATAAPPSEKSTSAAKGPFESLRFKDIGKKGANGWPRFDAYNVSDKTVTFAALYAYAYDKNGKLVARTATPLSWNTFVEAGARAGMGEVGRSDAKPVPANAVTFEICYNSVKFEGDARPTEDAKRCGDKRAEGGK